MRSVLLLVACVACDAADVPDPSPTNPEPTETRPHCTSIHMTASCSFITAATRTSVSGGAGSHSLCRVEATREATCTACALEAMVADFRAYYPGQPAGDLWDLAGSPEALCAETPEAKVGDACDPGERQLTTFVLPSKSCLPTRARLAADGTVLGQSYLQCVSGTCQAASAPVVTRYLEACDSALVAQYAMMNVNGVVAEAPAVNREACLLAWDGTETRSGVTMTCVGDWQCPEGSLCDDQMTMLKPATSPVAVCKPGPRGTLTAAMFRAGS